MFKGRRDSLKELHPVSPNVGMLLDPSIAWGNDEDDYGPTHSSSQKQQQHQQQRQPTFQKSYLLAQPLSPISSPNRTHSTDNTKNHSMLVSHSSLNSPSKKTPKKNNRHKYSSSVYAASNTSRMSRTSSQFDLGAMQLSGMGSMGMTHSASTLNFLQNAVDEDLIEAQLNRVPSWAKFKETDINNGDGSPNNNNEINGPNKDRNFTQILFSDSNGNGGVSPLHSKTTANIKHKISPPESPESSKLILSPSSSTSNRLPKIRLGAILKPLRNGADSIVDDSFWRCFEDREDVAWNWNFYLFPLWCAGVLIRYFILFPIRLLLLILGILIFFIGFFLIRFWYLIGCNCRCCGHSNHLSVEGGLVRLFALSFVVSWTGVIRYHGIRPSNTMKKRVFVANHSSMIDVTMLLQRDNYSLVGQAHQGWVRFIQQVMLKSLHCVWFNRGEAKDRNAVFRKLQQHARNENGDLPPLLVFPEGTCVNTDHIIQFKKGVFSLDDDIAICPVALKYNSVFVDAYWNSRRYSFGRHLFNLMTSWSLICDVYYLEPQYRQKDETPVEFAARVQMMIARRAHLISRNWDGYMKYWQPSARFKRAQQLAFARESFPSVFERREHEDRDNGAEFKTGESIKNNENDISTKLGIRHRVTRGGGRTPK